MSQYDPPDPPPDPTHVECAGDCGSRISADDAHHIPPPGGGSVCLPCALDWAYRQHVLIGRDTGARTLVAMAGVFTAAAQECRRQAAQDERPERDRELPWIWRELEDEGVPSTGDRSVHTLRIAQATEHARSAGRLEGLEEAARVCDAAERADSRHFWGVANLERRAAAERCADEIRALIAKATPKKEDA